MAGPIPFTGEVPTEPRRITEDGGHSKPVSRSFIASFDVALIAAASLTGNGD